MLTLSPIFAQQWELGANISGSGYMGDINPSNPIYFKSFSGGLNLKYNLNPTWGVKAAANFLDLMGYDRDFSSELQQSRNLSFRNHVLEVSAVAEFNFFKFIANRKENRYTPYLFAGIAGIMHNPFVKFSGGEKYYLRDLYLENDLFDRTYKPSRYAMAIPFGAGFKYNISGPWTLGAELGYRTALTDHIDNVSGNYTTLIYSDLPASTRAIIDERTWKALADRSNNLENNAGKMRGNGQPLDGYMTAGVTVTYTFISRKCYWW